MTTGRMACAVLALAAVFALAGTPSVNFFSDSIGGVDALPAALMKSAQDAYDANMKGLGALDKGELDKAATYFSQALGLIANYTDARNNMAVVHFRKGDITQARQMWQSISEGDPGYAIAFYNLGVVDFYEKDYSACVPMLQKAVAISKKFVEALVMLGRAELALNKKREAAGYFREAWKAAPERAESWQFYAYGLVCNGDTTEAVNVLSKHQDNAAALKMLGEIASFRKNYKAASSYFADAVSRGGNPNQLLDLASSQIDQHDCKDALATLKLYASKVSVQEADAYLYAGISAKDCGDPAASRGYFEKGLEKYPSDPILRYNLGQIYFQLKQFDLAESMWRTVSDSLNDPSLYYLRALNARRTGNLDLAETYVRNALRRDERPEYLDLLGVILYSKGKKDEAAAAFKKALALDPDLRSAQLNLALVSQSKEDLERTAEELERDRADCRSKCQDVALRLSVIYYTLGNVDKAAHELETLPDGEKNERIFRHLALYFRDLHEWNKAISTLEKAKTFFVMDQQTEYELAEDYLFSGDNRKAVDALNELLGKWDQNPWRIYYQLGYAYMEMKEFAKAKSALQSSLKKKPDNLAAQGLIAFILNAEGEVGQARAIWEKTLKEDPSNVSLLVNMGLSLEKDGRFEEALGYYQKAQLLKRDDNAVWINIGNAYAGMDRNRDAQNAYTTALSSSKRTLAAYDIFLIAQKTGDEANAAAMLSILTSEFPSSVYTTRAQTEMSMWKKDTASALAKLEAISDKDPGDWLALARIYANKKNTARAGKCLDMLPAEPYWQKGKTGVLASLDFLSGNYVRALSEWKDLGDSSFATVYNMAIAAYNTKDYATAMSLGEKMVSRAHGDDRADVCRLVGNSAMGLKQWKKALEWYQQLEDLKPSDALVLYNLAIIGYNLGTMEESWTYYQKARQIDPKIENKDIEKRYQSLHSTGGGIEQIIDSVDYWYNAAVTMQDSAHDSVAEANYKKILEKNPSYYRAWNNLGQSILDAGNWTRPLNAILSRLKNGTTCPKRTPTSLIST